MSESTIPEPDEKPCDRRAATRSLLRSLELNAWLAVAAATYVVALMLVRHHSAWTPQLKAAVNLLPVLPGLLYLRSGIQLLRKMDELQRRIQFEALMFAALGTVVISTVINVFNAQGLEGKWAAHGLEVGGTYMSMFLLWSIGVTIANLRYR